MSLTWTDPPKLPLRGANRKVITDDLLAALRKRPGKWARIHGPLAPRSSASQTSVWRLQFPQLELTSRNEKGRAYVYARWRKA